ncbi:VCBS domain-containing protein [Zestomonas carbonaria]|uniref:DUF4347 domain-containing protein n=1 Tax=Zestomonas carbonaria TaxID=2762745 RepID=A0A7U7I781_9GAMM|nr:VCBS domain-containing protein [Pseudomonas carbonaria]CAD5105836.1 hypothetical protein PSEWESI4_00093 [Pseudomonas carbonaria]
MGGSVRSADRLGFRPRPLALALEQRILFDGAAAASVDHQNAERDGDTPHPTPAPTNTEAPAARHLVVLDKRVENREALTADIADSVEVLVLDGQQDSLAAISAALARLGKVDSLQIFSHGAAGQITLGSQQVSSDNIGQFASLLGGWGAHLNAGADIQLYGCNVGEGSAGRSLVDQLARLTGANVAASSDATGSAGKGGDWDLEVRHGDIDKAIALSAVALNAYDLLLADAAPTTELASAGQDVLLGDQFNFIVNFRNTSTQDGYAPFINLFMPATGRDGDDGVRFVSASYLGQTLNAQVITFDASGNATHPLARDSSGNPLVINAATYGMRPGDQMVVISLPYASVSQSQPVIPVQITASLSNLADTDLSNASPDLQIRVNSGFELGNDALNNPQNDPSLLEAGALVFTVHPTVVTIDQRIDAVEGETVTGPNHGRTLTLTTTPANGQVLNNVSVTQALPDNVQVTAIQPGAGGTLTSVTLHNGTVLTDPTEIAAAIASDSEFIRSFTIVYATMSGATDTLVDFYVPEIDANGQPVLDPVTGAPGTITFAAAEVTGLWTPIDPRDVTPPSTTIDFTGSGDETSIVAKSITLQKRVVLQADIGSAGVSPGDTLRYTLQLDISDYFAFGKDFFLNGALSVTDSLADGQTLSGPLTMSVTMGGITRNIALVVETTVNADGTTTLVFDIGQSLQVARAGSGWLAGDLAFEGARDGATIALISYAALVSQSYTPPNGNPHNEINEGDSLGNSATVEGTLLSDRFNLTGQSQSDDSGTTTTIPTSSVDIQLTQVNGAPPPTGDLRPGDVVTFRLSYDLVTGDYENFQLVAYLPLPLLDVAGFTWDQGTGVGQWTLGAGNTNGGPLPIVSVGPGNSLIFDFGDYVINSVEGSRIEVVFTMRVGDQPFADQRSLDVLAQSTQTTSIDHLVLVSSDVAVIVSVAEPHLNIRHGVVSSNHPGTVTGTTGSWLAPGTTGKPFAGSITDLNAIEGSANGIDGGDLLRLATAIENTGGGGAYDVVTSITLPPGLGFVGGSLASANLQIYRGDGTLLVAGVDYSVVGNEIRFIDRDGNAALLAGRVGTAADASGGNLVVITYDVVVNNAILAGRTLQSMATLSNYASVDNGQDFTPTDLTDDASQQVAAPVISKVFAGGSLDDSDSSAGHTTGSNLVVGESMLYDIVVTLPEGVTQNLRIDDLIPPGMRLDTTFNGGLGYQLIISSAASGGSLASNFAGSVVISGMTGVGGTLGADGVDARFTFSASTGTADNNTGNNSFVIRVRLVVSNVQGNQANQVLQNSANLQYQDPDGDTPNGTAPVDRLVGLSGGQPAVTVREPTLQISQTLTSTPGVGGYDEGDVVEFIITISNGNGSNDYAAFDLSLVDILPTELNNVQLLEVLYQGGATNNGGPDFAVGGGRLVSVGGANIDIAKGGSIILRLSGVVNATAAAEANFDNVATVQWTSLDGTQGGERTGVDGALNSGVLNDYQRSSTLIVPVARGILLSRVGGMPDTPAANPTTGEVENVTIGEIIRYRAAVLVPQGDNLNHQIRIELDAGLELIDPTQLANAIRIALVANQGGLESSLGNLVIGGGPLFVTGNENSEIAQSIRPDLSGISPTAILNPAHISVAIVGGRQVVTISLGDLTNHDGADADLEGVVLEFNVRVLNVAANQAATQLGVTVVESVNGIDRGRSPTLVERIVEPSFSGLDKRIVDFNPNASGTLGSATVRVDFTQNGGLAAYDVQLSDSFPSGSNYQLVSVQIGDTVYNAGNLPPGVTASVTASGVVLNFARLDVGTTVRAIYQVDLPNNSTIASSAANATLTWSSLPESFTGWGGSSVGVDGTANGERTGSNVGPNSYILQEGAGVGVIRGTLWNDTQSATASATPDGPGLAGQTVTLTWAGADGNLATTADNRTFTAITDANGAYHFGVLPDGIFRIDTPNAVIYPQPLGELRVRIDTDAATPLGRIDVTLGEGVEAQANAGYVERNDAPVNQVPGDQVAQEDEVLNIGGISVSDIDVGNRPIEVTLRVQHGILDFSSFPPGVLIVVIGDGTSEVTLAGSVGDINLVLANLTYLGDLNFNGIDTLTVITNDLGGFGDADGDGIPGETVDDALTDIDTVRIVVNPVNDLPVANPDTALATEAGGLDNGRPGVNPAGSVVDNDTDVDIATNADVLRVVHIRSEGSGLEHEVSVPGLVSLPGLYGQLIITSLGTYLYLVDNDNPEVEALRTASDTLSDVFTYTIRDLAGATAISTLTVIIRGANDNPVGVDDEGEAIEAGGVNNGTPGQDATGNVLDNDTDVDGGPGDPIDYGETRTVTGIRTLRESAPGAFTAVAATGETRIDGTHGSLFIQADGTYRYEVNNDSTAVQRLVAGDTLFEYFSYVVTDAGGLNDVAELRITIHGANDNPVASDDQAAAQAAAPGVPNSQESNPRGNVILFPSRPGDINQPGGNGVDLDVDRLDRPSSNLVVTGIHSSPELGAPATLTDVAGGTTSDNGTAIEGLYAVLSDGTIIDGTGGSFGTLTIGADGSFFFDVNSDNALVQGLNEGATLTVYFTYEIADTAGLTDRAQLLIIVRGVNDPPVAQDQEVEAIEAGGVNNGTPGSDATGNALSAAFDPEGDPLTVTLIRTGTGSDVEVVDGGTSLDGQYGTLTIHPDGSFTYVIDNDDSAVQALRQLDDQLIERFVFTVDDRQNENDIGSAEIIVTIRGQNDNPVAADDEAIAIESGGVNNGQHGVDPVGNVLDNDSDVDSVANGETREVSSVRTGSEAGTGTDGVLGIELRGAYGWLLLNADGSYGYRLDNAMAEVQALLPGETLNDLFSYTLRDTAGAEDRATLTITIQGANDNPVANDDSGLAIEAGGVANDLPGSDATGNVLGNDTDVDAGDSLQVVSVRQGPRVGLAGVVFAGTYGNLTLDANGNYTYVVNNDHPLVQALRTGADTLRESFSYTVRDLNGAISSALLTITIQGRNDNPVAVDDNAVAIEAGGTLNSTPGVDPTGNLLDNDTDVDANDSKQVDGIRLGNEAAGGGFTAVNGETVIAGLYGSLRVSADGSYQYVVDNLLAAVQALKVGDTLVEEFTYRMRDALGGSDTAQLTVLIRGAWDAPVAVNDVAFAVAAGPGSVGVDPVGNVLPNDTDVDSEDVDLVNGIRHGERAAGGVMIAVGMNTSRSDGTVIVGRYGRLIIGSDGSFVYSVANDSPEVLALGPFDIGIDTFTYQIFDRGQLVDTAELTIFVRGQNNPPDLVNDTGIAVEAGGLDNGTPGVDPTGNVLANDSDVEGDELTVVLVHKGDVAGAPGTPIRGLYGDLTMNADGSWSYLLDNALPEVQALRTAGQTLTEVFTYTVTDIWGGTAQAQLVITIEGRNDNPVAVDDNAVAVEAGGVANGTPGVNPTGNVLDNDTDVDSVANGETRQVLSVRNSSGQGVDAGQRLAGVYGWLVLNADGSYSYELDNANPQVQALRTAGETLSEVFVYRMRDTAGATSEARLNILIRGANDAPVAQNDSNVASDQVRAPHTSGNVLPNDSDIDNGDSLSVVGIRTGPESGSGTVGVIGQPLAGRYGTLVIHADGSYTYTIDLTNPEVLAAAGLGQVLQDVFTYRISDLAGGTDEAELVIHLDIEAPFIPAPKDGPFIPYGRDDPQIGGLPLPDVDPAVFVGPVVERESRIDELRSRQSDGSDIELVRAPWLRSESLGAGLGLVPGQFISDVVRRSSLESDLDMDWIMGRHGRIELSADGLLSEPSLHAVSMDGVAQASPPPSEPRGRMASDFSSQLQAAAQRLHPIHHHAPPPDESAGPGI